MIDVIGVISAFNNVADERAEREDGGGADFGDVVGEQFEELLVGVVPDADPFGRRVFIPHLTQANGEPLPQMRIVGGHLVDASVDELLMGDFFALLEILDDGGEDKGGHRPSVRWHHVIAQNCEEILMPAVFD